VRNGHFVGSGVFAGVALTDGKRRAACAIELPLDVA